MVYCVISRARKRPGDEANMLSCQCSLLPYMYCTCSFSRLIHRHVDTHVHACTHVHVHGAKDLWCSSTVWLLSTQM